MVLNIEKIDVTMSSFEQPKLTSKMLYHQNLDLKKKIHFKSIITYASLVFGKISQDRLKA